MKKLEKLKRNEMRNVKGGTAARKFCAVNCFDFSHNLIGTVLVPTCAIDPMQICEENVAGTTASATCAC